MVSIILGYPASYGFAILLAMMLAAETILRFDAPWRLPYAAVLGTVSAWYLIEPIYSQDTFSVFDRRDVGSAFVSVILFLVALRVFTPLVAPAGMRHRGAPRRASVEISPDVARTLLLSVIALWVVMAAIGFWRADGYIVESLYPNGRVGSHAMWGRNGISTGIGDTLVGIAGYVYIIVLANFGVLLVFVDRLWLRAICVVLIVVTWPYAFLIGARTVALAVFLPGFLAFLIYARTPPLLKLTATLAAFLAINMVFKIIIAYRDLGFDHIGQVNLSDVHHDGLNMASELVYIIGFLRSHVLNLQWGYGYVADISQLIPRSLWPDKPGIEFDYSIARGFGSTTDANAVLVTISQGLIGQGVRQFGYIGGALCAAFIMAIWCRILAGLRMSRQVSRACLFLLGLGLTFNLGRDVSLLVLWPFVMAYLIVIAYELVTGRRRGPPRGAALPHGVGGRHIRLT